MNKQDLIDRKKMVLCMEYIMRNLNDEDLLESWFMLGVADGDIEYGNFDIDSVDEYYTESDNFKELMDLFVRIIQRSDNETYGTFYCGRIVS